MIKLFTTHCPKCIVLESKLKTKNIKYNVITDLDEMQAKNFMSVPMLQIDNTILDFSQAIRWVNEQQGD